MLYYSDVGPELPNMEQYSILGRIGEGAHGIVLKAKHIEVRIFFMSIYIYIYI